MTQHLFNESAATVRRSFLARQFAEEKTAAQDFFDGLFGVFLPVFCFVADPLFFKQTSGSAGIYGDYQVLVYTFSAVQIVTLMTWRTFGRHFPWLAAPIGGVFIAGALCSMSIGIAILPFTLIGLFMVVGLLGFIPFFTAYVYLRTGVRAMKSSQRNSGVTSSLPLAIPAAIIAIALPIAVSNLVSSFVSASVSEVITRDHTRAEVAVSRLKRVPFKSQRELGRIVEAYHLERNPEKRQALSRYYTEITGRDIEFRPYDIND